MVEAVEARTKAGVLLVLGGLLLVGFMTTSFASYFISKQNIRESVMRHELPLASDNIHSEIEQILLPPLNVAETMANSVFLRDWMLGGEQDVGKITDYLNRIQTKQGMSSAFLVSEKTRNYYSHEGVRDPVDPDQRDQWYASCRDGKADFEINADLDFHVSNSLNLFVNYKVYDYEGNFIGIAGVAERIDSIETLVRRFREQYGKRIYFVSPDGKVAFRGAAGADLLVKPDLADFIGSVQLADQLLSTPASTFEYQRNGRDILLNARYFPELRWYLVVEEDVRQSTEHLRRILAMNLVVCLLLTLLVLGIVFRVGRQYRQRLLSGHQQLVELAGELEEQNTRLARLNRESDEFMKMVVHDLKSPVSGLIGMARLIREEEDTAVIHDFAAHMEESGEEISEILQNLLYAKSVESTRLPEMKPVDVEQVVDSRWNSWAAYAEGKSIKLVRSGFRGSVCVEAPWDWLLSVISNLISNAIKFSPQGTQVVLDLAVGEQSVCISVIDQGPGILPQEREMLFRQFSRLSSRPTGGESSSGLGLYIVKTMVDKLGGAVGVESESGKGSRFWVELPRCGA